MDVVCVRMIFICGENFSKDKKNMKKEWMFFFKIYSSPFFE